MIKSYKQLIKITPKELESYDSLSVALLSDQSTQYLKKVLYGSGITNLVDLKIWEAPINSIEDQIHNPASPLNSSSFQYLILFESSHLILKTFNCFDDKKAFAEDQFNRIKQNLSRGLEKAERKIILFNFYELNDFIYGNFSSKHEESFIFQLRKLNFLISQHVSSQSRVFLLDISSTQNLLGSSALLNSSFYINYEMVLTLDCLPLICKNIIDIIQAQRALFKKCLIVDLDNTLWGGIIGDDGLERIELGNLGIGKAFVELQCWIKKLKERGVIICVCSKNNEDVAQNVFNNHPDMVLSLNDISVFIANWDSKVDNIKKIQSVLNIGFDSMVFLDDNPFERNIVKENITGIVVPELPEDPSNYLDFLYKENLFETSSASSLDKDRTKLYQVEHKRTKEIKNFTDLTEYMQNLKMVACIKPLSRYNIPRVSQLSLRSNQFNLRTIRYAEEDLSKIMNSDSQFGLAVELKDKFGDHGIISFLILKKTSNQDIFIENWAMSCRVIERGVEELIFNFLIDFCEKGGYENLFSEYIQTPKNLLVKNLYKKLGFLEVNEKFLIKLSAAKRLLTTIKINNE